MKNKIEDKSSALEIEKLARQKKLRERQRKFRSKQKELGLHQVTFYVTQEQVIKIREMLKEK